MKSFDSYLQRCIRNEWSPHYMNYPNLKAKLRQFYKRRRRVQKLLLGSALTTEEFQVLAGGVGDADKSGYFAYIDQNSCKLHIDREDALLRLSIVERTEFSELLEQEVSKAATFYSGTLLNDLRVSIENKNSEVASTELLEATAFCVTNIITFRQVLIRYDGFRRTFDGIPLSEWHLQRSILGNRHPVHALFQLKDLYELEHRLVCEMQRRKESTERLSMQSECFQHLLQKTNDALDKAVAGHVVFRDRVIATIRQYFLFGFQSRGLVHSPKILMKGRHLKPELRAVAKWRETKEFPLTEQYPDSFSQRLMQLKPENVFPLLLNLLSCFFFMMNNYIIEPSSAYYANALGSSDALSGIMIGAAPWFAMVSAVGYSYWTNHNYKCPIIFAGCLQLIGNFMYANAYSYSSMSMCLFGRVLTGLGAPRIINRRYVADATPFSLRTAASAAFAMATALGAALGPGMAIVLDNVEEFEFSIPFLEQQYFNAMTGPGYFMALCWGIYTVVIILFFEEPTRSGLEELREREEAGVIKGIDPKPVTLLDRQDTLLTIEEGYESDASENETDVSSTYFREQPGKQRWICCSCLQHMTTPVIITMSLIFMKRIALEAIVGSTSVITKNRFGWKIQNVGTLHLVNGVIVIPVSALSGWLSTFYEDRYMAIWFLCITLVGMGCLFDPTDLGESPGSVTYNAEDDLSVGPIRYIAGSLIAFSGIEACESFVASLMSKVVPSALAQGTFNSGLLTTLVGTVRINFVTILLCYYFVLS